MGKTPLILAPVIVGALMLWLAFWMGKVFERAGRRYAASFIDPTTHNDLVELVRRVLSPADVEHACFLPEPVAEQAQALLQRADEQAARRRRAELRRRGF